MARVITFSRVFPKYHPKAGQPTFFVEKIYKSLYQMKVVPTGLQDTYNFAIMNDDNVAPKHHTIRAGNRWKVGDKFSPRVWSDKPYQSKMITLASDIELKKVWNVKIVKERGLFCIKMKDGSHPENFSQLLKIKEVANNDGLQSTEFLDWFNIHPKQQNGIFIGQILCWNENINY